MKRTAIRRTPMKPGKAQSWNSTLNTRSPKQRVKDEGRRELAAEMLVLGARCEAHQAEAPGACFGVLTLHEVLSRARGGSITDRANIKVVCAWHNTAISQDTETMRWALANGFLRHAWDGAA